MVNFIYNQVQQFDCSGMKSQDTKFPLLQNESDMQLTSLRAYQRATF